MSAPDAITRLNHALEGRYHLDHELGEGGMATVYLADDLKHQRKVAIKVLKPDLAAVVGGDRFLAEITTTANLQHPHILPLFDSGEADGFLFFVMPHVEGESLRERLDREKQLPVDEAVRMTAALAEALQHAHDRGVIHRDIKPANILLQGGQPVIADFGIALAVGAAGGSRLTETGLSVGTPYYMSPEQATGDQGIGPASDTYGLAAMLFEMLTGDPPYTGSTAQAVLGKILQGTPVSAKELRSSVPAHVDAAIRRGLERIPADRFGGASDFAKALLDPTFRHGEAAGVVAGAPASQWNRLTSGMFAAAVLASVLAAASWMRTPESNGPLARFETPFRSDQRPIGPFELLGDSGILYVGEGAEPGTSQLLIRRWANLDASPIPGTEGVRVDRNGNRLAVSPDRREVVFVVGSPGPVRIAALTGGVSRTVAESAWSAAWSDDDWIYFMRGADFGLSRVRANGTEEETLTVREEGETFHVRPEPLAGGRTLLFQVIRTADGSDAQVWALDLDTRERTLVTVGDSPRYVDDGILLFGSYGGPLMAARFDEADRSLVGPPVPIASGLFTSTPRGHSVFAASNDALAYLAGGGLAGLHEFVWVDRSGSATPVHEGEQFAVSPTGPDGWRLSPDGSRIAFGRNVDGNDDIWVKTLPEGPLMRVTFDPGMDLGPSWSPDGRTLLYRNGGLGVARLWTMRADGVGQPELAFDAFNPARGSLSSDGAWMVLRRAGVAGQEGSRDVLAMRVGGTEEPFPISASPDFAEVGPALSRDGRWIAYSSDETGRQEVFVRPFPDASAAKWQVSTNGGSNPVWAHNGEELFFYQPVQGTMNSVTFDAAGEQFRAQTPEVLFQIPATYFLSLTGIDEFYDVSLDDQRFLMARPYGGDAATVSLILVQNYLEEVRQLLPE